MATMRLRPSGTVEAIIRRKCLPGPISLTFKTMEEAEAYCKEAEALIDAGTIPPALLEYAKPKADRRERPEHLAKTVAVAIDEYLRGYAVKSGDVEWLAAMRAEFGETELAKVTVQWMLEKVRGYKVERRLTPATIRHRVGALRRCLDWHVTCGELPMNPLKLLPLRYASYSDTEKSAVGEDAPEDDNARDRRLEPGEEERIRKVLANDPEYIKELGVERGIKPESQEPMTLLFTLALETAMRMREIYTLTADQVDIERRTIFLDKTKNGDKRQVPLSSVALLALEPYRGLPRNGRLFPEFWNGEADKASLQRSSRKLSQRWRTIARLAKCHNLHFHDLRHEATSRLYERTTLSDVQIAKITGHKSLEMLKRYANLRASNLAESLW